MLRQIDYEQYAKKENNVIVQKNLLQGSLSDHANPTSTPAI